MTGRSTGHPVRCLKNKLTREFEKKEADKATIEELDNLGKGRLQAAVLDGDVVNGSVMAGQVAGLINDIKPCSEIINDLVGGISEVMDRIKTIYGGK